MKIRKIGILTQPLQTNYGGLLQNYALQKVLCDAGNEVETIQIRTKMFSTALIRAIAYGRRFISKYLLNRYKGDIFAYLLTIEDFKKISKYTDRFIAQHIRITPIVYNKIEKSDAVEFDYNAYVVGSDQVWRPCYSPFLPNFFLDFLSEENKAKKIAYGASFGVGEWEFSVEETEMAQKYIRKFDTVSVREDSGVALCKEFLNVEAAHVLDPTMLLQKEDYIHLVNQAEISSSNGNLMAYVLDESLDKQQIVKTVSQELGLIAFQVMPSKRLTDKKPIDIAKYVFPPVEQWLRGFIDAEFVVTDSFHGVVFSIIFNKPFIAIANRGRGLDRFTSLLRIFKLEHRLIFSARDLNKSLLCSIDYTEANHILKQKREYSLSILNSCLC